MVPRRFFWPLNRLGWSRTQVNQLDTLKRAENGFPRDSNDCPGCRACKPPHFKDAIGGCGGK